MKYTSRLGVGLAALALISACSDQGRKDDAGNSADGPDDGILDDGVADLGDDDDGIRLDLGSGDGDGDSSDDGNNGECTDADLPATDAVLEGTVYSPSLEIPISGALVYLSRDPVEPIPDGTYCAECVVLDCDVHWVLTEPDGSFSLPAQSGSGWSLVVQKGQFLHVTPLDVPTGTTAVPANVSNLPGEWNPAQGMWIPRIAVYETYPDEIYNVLAKFGLGQVSAGGQLVAGTERFTLISDTDQGAFLDDPNAMSAYHLVFLPCASTKTWIGAPSVPAARAQNIRDYVDSGGKIYATDHSNEYIEEPFPSYQEFHAPSMPDIQPAYTSQGLVIEPGLLAWLQALPAPLKDIGSGYPTLNFLPGITTELNYSAIDDTFAVIVQNEKGEDVDVGHDTFVEGPCSSCTSPSTMRPMAVSGQYGCGRMMFSTFEASSVAHQGLSPQELVLLYMILEIGVCFGEKPPPPPPVG